ncbi:MAG: DUF4296 domain-containing protein [Bacteroidales bacterium]|nr:DUF4296 domain-containing protein [Bacteroidales bacterium]
MLLSTSIVLLMFSCSIGKRKFIIPEKKLIPVLVDIHLADGIGIVVPYSDVSKRIDSATLYNAVFTKHHITRAMFDSSMAYYTKKPEKLQAIYTEVNAILNKKSSDLETDKEEPEVEKKILVWQDNKAYVLPQMGNINKVEISLPVSKPGFYTISAKIRLFDDDQTVAPRITCYFWYDNGSPKGFREYFRSSPVKKDEKTVTYTVTHKLSNPKITHIKGFILDHSNLDTLFTKHAIVSDIKVYFRE